MVAVRYTVRYIRYGIRYKRGLIRYIRYTECLIYRACSACSACSGLIRGRGRQVSHPDVMQV
jgi:hypothetical protein